MVLHTHVRKKSCELGRAVAFGVYHSCNIVFGIREMIRSLPCCGIYIVHRPEPTKMSNYRAHSALVNFTETHKTMYFSHLIIKVILLALHNHM